MIKRTGLRCFAVALLLLGPPVVAAEAPSAGAVAGLQDVFVPDPTAGADYVATMRVTRGSDETGGVSQVVTRRGPWLRVDKTTGGRTSTDYVGLVSGAWIIAPDLTARSSGLQITRLGPPVACLDSASHATAEQDNVLGETCRVWDVYRSVGPRGAGFRRLGCVTADGIEVWRKTIGARGATISAGRTMAVERRTAARVFVEPPRNLLDLKPWLATPAATVNPQGDFEVLLATTPPGGRIHVRRHAVWTYEETMGPSGRSTVSWREDGRVRFSLRLDREGAAQTLAFQRSDRATNDHAQPMARPSDVVLGEPCNWFDLGVGLADAGRKECRAGDGAPLKIILTEWASDTVYVAERVSRRRLQVGQVLPPQELLARRLWGLPE